MILGLRCSSKDFGFAVLDGTRANPKIVASGIVAFPKGFSRVQCVNWFYQELIGILDTHPSSAIVMKAFEGRARDNSFVERIEHESMAYLAASRKGIKSVQRKVKSTIAKDLGLKGRARYLGTQLDTSVLNGYDALPEKTQDAALAGWTALP